MEENVIPFFLLNKLQTRSNLLHMLRGAGYNTVQQLLTLVSTMHIIVSASLQYRVSRELTCPTGKDTRGLTSGHGLAHKSRWALLQDGSLMYLC